MGKAIIAGVRLLLLLSVLSLVECRPTPPACSVGTSLACPAHEIRACLSQCAPRASVGEACTPDPCAAGPEAGVCSPPASCVDGTCQDFGLSLLARCDPADAAHPCATGTFCKSFSSNGATGCMPRPEFEYYDGAVGGCALPVGEGGTCDSNYSDPNCRPCEPGTTCTEGRCRRPCEQDNDCPCGDGCLDGHCSACNGNQGDCSDGTPCCDGQDTCQQGTCCRGFRAACDPGAMYDQCCSGTRCNGERGAASRADLE